jgi:aquaporin Z
MSDFYLFTKFFMKKMLAECIGTMVLVVFGCGVAVWTGVDPVATALAF